MTDPLIQAGNNAANNLPTGQVDSSNANIPAGQTGSPWSTAPTVMTPAQAFGNSPSQVPTVQPDNSHSGLVAGAQQTSQTIDQTIASLTPQPTALDSQQQGLLNDISSLTGAEENKAPDLLAAQQGQNVPGLNQDLTDVNNQIKAETAAYNAKYANAELNPGVLTADVTGQQGALQRANAAQIGLLTAKAQAIQGNLNLAMKTASDAIDAKYSAIEAKLKTKQAQLDAIAPMLNKQQQTQALAQKQLLDKQAQDVADEKQKVKDNINIGLQVGAKTKFINNNGEFFNTATGQTYKTPQDFFAASGATSFEDAYQKGLITDYTPAKAQEVNLVQQMAAKYPDAGIKSTDTPEEATAKLQSSRIYRKETYIAPTASSRVGVSGSGYKAIDVSSVADKNAPNKEWGGLSYNGLYNDAKLFLANNGKMPSLGLGSNQDTQAKRDAIQNYAGQLADAAGMDVTQISALYKSNSKAASEIIGRVAKVEATSGALTSQFPRLAELAGKVGTMGIKESDITAGKAAVQRKFGSVDAANYAELIQTVRGDYTAMQSALGGGRGGEFFAKNAQEAIPIGLTPEQYMGIMDTIQQSAEVSASATQEEAQKLLGTGGGTIRVKEKSSGQTGTIDASEFDPNLYDKLP